MLILFVDGWVVNDSQKDEPIYFKNAAQHCVQPTASLAPLRFAAQVTQTVEPDSCTI